jgi:excisionase family DNA binding protein
MEEKEYLSTKDLAAYLGKSEKFVYKHIADRRLPGMTRIGGRWGFRRSDVDRNLNRGELLLPKAA